MSSTLIRRQRHAYEPAVDDPAATLRLDRTEPPIPYRENAGTRYTGSTRYPSASALEARLARRFGIGQENIMVTAGADEALDRACRAVLLPGDELLTTAPKFEMIEKYGSLANASVKSVPWLADEFPLSEFLCAYSATTQLSILVSPNNPTGKCIPLEAIVTVASEFPDRVLLLDFAYIEFANADTTPELLRFPNILIVRSFSKAWGLPGLRVGYALGSAEVIQAMRAAGGPYSVAATSMQTIETNFESREREMREYVRWIRQERNDLEAWLAEAEIAFIPSQSNFILLFPEQAQTFDATLRASGIRTREFDSSDLPRAARRLTLPGNPEAADLLRSALERYFQLQLLES